MDTSDSKEMIKASIAETIGKPGKSFPKAAVLQNLFSLAFNRNGSQEIILTLPYNKRNFHLDQLIFSNYPHFEEYLETIIKVLAIYRKRKNVDKLWILMIFWKTGWNCFWFMG